MENKDRIQYAHSIDTGEKFEYSTVLLNNFDQLMGLYGFIQPCNYTVEIVDTRDDILILNMKFPDGESGLKIANLLNMSDKTLCVYQKVFEFNVVPVSLDTLQLTFVTK